MAVLYSKALLSVIACLALLGGVRAECPDQDEYDMRAGDTGTIASHYPSWDGEEYDTNEYCSWVFTAPNNYRIVLTVHYFDTEAGADYIYIGEGDEPGANVLQQWTGHRPPQLNVISPENELWVLFESDWDIGGMGFILNVTLEHKNDLEECDSGEKILEENICDNVVHCEDLSDELDCVCSNSDFECGNGICVNNDALCDGYNDCKDFSDEKDCPVCTTITSSKCASRLDYSTTYFPNLFMSQPRKAKRLYRIARRISDCHPLFLTHLCNTLFPECPHNGPVARMCRSTCHEIEESCRSRFLDSNMGDDWGLQCDTFSNEDPQEDGYCAGPEGDFTNTGECGIRPLFDDRIVGGINAGAGEWPWIGSLRNRNGHVCGATLIHSRWAVTAAHCVGYFNKVVFGDIRLSQESARHFETGFDDIIVHPNYEDWWTQNDIALLRLSEAAPDNDYITPSCLAMNHRDHDEGSKPYRNCHVVGWGHTEEDGDVSNVLQQALVGIIPQWKCSENYDLSNEMICAGYMEGGVDTCQGDSGGPLVCHGIDGRWHLVGITSFGEGCARAGHPGVYARVSQFTGWIHEVMRDHEHGHD